jgi:hypothetical protein
VTTPADPLAPLRSRAYPVAGGDDDLGRVDLRSRLNFLALVSYLEKERFTHLPQGLGYSTVPAWWPLLVIGGLMTALAIRYLPGHGGASPVPGFAVHPRPPRSSFPASSWRRCVAGARRSDRPRDAAYRVGSGLAVLATKAARRRPVPA